MITWFVGDNSFEIQQAVKEKAEAFTHDHSVQPERIDGTTLELKDIPDLLMGATLFADKRMVIINDLSQNQTVWEKLPSWLDRMSDDMTLLLIDSKPDKRTTPYKEVKKRASLQEFPAWTDRDSGAAAAWLKEYAARHAVTLDAALARYLVDRVGLDQWQLASATEKLSLSGRAVITTDVIDDLIDEQPIENVFRLFELALEKRFADVHDSIHTLELTQDPYQLFALLSSQVFQLAAICHAGQNDTPAKDFAIHPFVVTKLQRHKRTIRPARIRTMIRSFAKADSDMKQSRADPWLLIEKALLSMQD